MALAVMSCPPPLCPHAEFALAAVLGQQVSLTWERQPADPTQLSARLELWGRPGTAALVAGRLRGLRAVRFEVAEVPGPGVEGERFSYTPRLGLYRAALGPHGDVTVGEGQLRSLLSRCGTGAALADGVERLLGTAWDDELEPYRAGGGQASVTWLPRTG